MMLTNFIVILSSILALITSNPSMMISRFIYGAAAGVFSVVGPRFLGEVSPLEVSGPAGTLTQLTVTFGILVAFVVGSFFADSSDL